jgi:hypothetical protein
MVLSPEKGRCSMDKVPKATLQKRKCVKFGRGKGGKKVCRKYSK